MRECMCTDKFVQSALEHFCKMRQFAAPEFLRQLVADGVQRNMPQGLIVHKVTLRAGTLAAVATGSDMLKISLPDLARQLLGPGVSSVAKDRICSIFQRAECMGKDEILEELEKHEQSIVALNMAEHAAKQAVNRLKNHMARILGGKLPECPITMEEIPKERVRILACCTCVIDADSLEGCKGRCPLCRAPITKMGAMEEDAAAEEDAEDAKRKLPPVEEMGQKSKQAKLSFTDGRGSPSLKEAEDYSFEDSDAGDDDEGGPRNEGDEGMEVPGVDAFEAEIARISAERPHSVDGILEVLLAQVSFNASSRMLLCFGFQQGQRGIVGQISDRIERELPGSKVFDIDQCAKDYMRMDAAKQKFDDPVRYPQPIIFIINTTDTSSSVQGLDLHATDLTVVADQCSLPTQRQAVGRSLRMKKRSRKMKRDELFPAKRIVVAAIGGFA